MNFNQSLIDQIIAHGLGLERLKAGLANEYSRKLNRVDKAIQGLFLSAIGATRKEQRRLFKEIAIIKAESYHLMESEFIKELALIAEKQTKWMVLLFGTALVPSMIESPGPLRLSIVNNLEIRGRTVSKTLRDLNKTEVSRIEALARTAVNDSLTLIEAREAFKLLTFKRKNSIRAITHTAVTGANSIANNLVYAKNSHLIKGIKLAVVFDNRTTPICIKHSIDDILYPVDNYPRAPFHWQCRTIEVPIVKSYSEMGLKVRTKVPVGTRASMTGTISMDTTYNQWLKRQPRKIQDDALGKTRAALFRKGDFPLKKFIDPTGKFYTVDDLFSKYDI